MIVCADDFGLAEDINRAILELCRLGQLSAVSCMAALPQCTAEVMQELLKYQASVDIGLHLYLADKHSPGLVSGDEVEISLAVPTYNAFLRRALSGKVQAEAIAEQISAQYECFLEKIGRRPDFIDSHLYVHQLPGAREGLMRFALGLPALCRPYFRNTQVGLRELRSRRLPWFKAFLIGRFGAAMFTLLSAASLPTNRGFAGIYDFRSWPQFPQYLPRFVDCLSDANALLVTHPGGNEKWRLHEFKTLRGFSFPKGPPTRFVRTVARAGATSTL
jgi:hypothetical protein